MTPSTQRVFRWVEVFGVPIEALARRVRQVVMHRPESAVVSAVPVLADLGGAGGRLGWPGRIRAGLGLRVRHHSHAVVRYV